MGRIPRTGCQSRSAQRIQCPPPFVSTRPQVNGFLLPGSPESIGEGAVDKVSDIVREKYGIRSGCIAGKGASGHIGADSFPDVSRDVSGVFPAPGIGAAEGVAVV